MFFCQPFLCSSCLSFVSITTQSIDLDDILCFICSLSILWFRWEYDINAPQSTLYSRDASSSAVERERERANVLKLDIMPADYLWHRALFSDHNSLNALMTPFYNTILDTAKVQKNCSCTPKALKKFLKCLQVKAASLLVMIFVSGSH